MKKCIDCKLEKTRDCFNKHRDRTDGFQDFCRECSKIRWQKKIAGGYAEKHRESARNDYYKNREQRKKKANEYYYANKEVVLKKQLAKQKERLQQDPEYRLSRRLRNRLYYALKRKSWKKNTKFAEYIGCTLEELKLHLEKQFVDGMSWENMGLWHVDHKIPLVSAQNEEEMYKLCHYSNLAPMWAKENIKKGSKV